MANYSDESTYSTASGIDGLKYVVLQVTLKEKFLGTGSGNLSALESVLNEQAAKGYRLHTITTASATSSGFLGGDRIQATMVFEKILLCRFSVCSISLEISKTLRPVSFTFPGVCTARSISRVFLRIHPLFTGLFRYGKRTICMVMPAYLMEALERDLGFTISGIPSLLSHFVKWSTTKRI